LSGFQRPDTNRPSQADRARHLFQLSQGTETEREMARATAAGILDDLCSQSRKAWKKHGEGFFVYRIDAAEEIWATPTLLKDLINVAAKRGDFGTARFFRQLIDQFEEHDHRTQTLLVLEDEHGYRACMLDNDNPLGTLPQVLKEVSDGLAVTNEPPPPLGLPHPSIDKPRTLESPETD
jgi:hypothetical protein